MKTLPMDTSPIQRLRKKSFAIQLISLRKDTAFRIRHLVEALLAGQHHMFFLDILLEAATGAWQRVHKSVTWILHTSLQSPLNCLPAGVSANNALRKMMPYYEREHQVSLLNSGKFLRLLQQAWRLQISTVCIHSMQKPHQSN